MNTSTTLKLKGLRVNSPQLITWELAMHGENGWNDGSKCRNGSHYILIEWKIGYNIWSVKYKIWVNKKWKDRRKKCYAWGIW